jgi:hypothetical protein
MNVDESVDSGNFRDDEKLENSLEHQFDFSAYHALDADRLAGFVYRYAFLGLGDAWQQHEPEAEDERYQRCLAAAGVALDHLWDEDATCAPGNAPDAADDLVFAVYRSVDSFAFSKINQYYAALGEGISTPEWRSQCRRSEAAARRAVASLFGSAAMSRAQEMMNAENARLAAEWQAERAAERQARELGLKSDAVEPDPEMDRDAFEAELDALGG